MHRLLLGVVVASGCSGPSASVDASPTDTATDSSVEHPSDAAIDAPVDAPFVEVTCLDDPTGVTVANHDGRTIVVHDAAGVPQCAIDVMPGQLVRVPMSVDGMLSVLTRFTSQRPNILTITHLQPGDLMDSHSRSIRRNGQLEVTFTTYPQATSYVLGCGNVSTTASPLSTTMYPNTCVGSDGMVHDLLFARDATNATIAYADLGALAPTLGAVTAGAWRTDFVTRTTSTASPAGLTVGGALASVEIDSEYTGSVTTASGMYPAITDGIFGWSLSDRMEYRTLAATDSLTFDPAVDVLPNFTSLATSGTIARPTFAWTTDGPLQRGFLAVQHQYRGTGAGAIQEKWVVIVPHDTPSPIVFPSLYPSLQPAGTIEQPSVMAIDTGEAYASVRLHPLRPFRVPGFQAEGAFARWSLSVRGDFDQL